MNQGKNVSKIDLPSIKRVQEISVSPLKSPKDPNDEKIETLRDAVVAVHKCLGEVVARLNQLESESRD